MDFNNLHNHYEDVDFKKGFKKTFALSYYFIYFDSILNSLLP